MTELTFSRDEAERLANKLDMLKPQLSGPEQELLLAIFSAAAGQVRQTSPAGPRDTTGQADLTNLRDQLLHSFIPGNGQAFTIESIRIGPGE